MSFNKTHLLKKPKIFYGYWIVLVGFLCLFITSGFGQYAFSLFVKALQEDLGWSRGEIYVAFTIFLSISGVTSPFVGRMVDRYGAKWVIAIGAAIAGLGFLLLTQIDNLWQFYLSYVITGIGISAMGMVSASAVVSNWFHEKRGFAIGLMSMGLGGGGFVMAPIIGGYIIPNFGWRIAYLAIALFIWVLIIPSALLVLKMRPADMGLYPDGAEAPAEAARARGRPSAPGGLSLKMALATSAFWLISISFLTRSFTQMGSNQSQFPHLQDIGFSATTAATVLGTVGLFSAIGKFIFGWLCDHMPPKYACAIGLGFLAVGVAMLLNMKPTWHPALMWIYAIVMGLGIGSWLPTMSILISTSFGLTYYGTIFGMVSLMSSAGAATGPLMAGYMYDVTHTYGLAFSIFLSLFVISIPAILLVRRPKSLQS